MVELHQSGISKAAPKGYVFVICVTIVRLGMISASKPELECKLVPKLPDDIEIDRSQSGKTFAKDRIVVVNIMEHQPQIRISEKLLPVSLSVGLFFNKN